MVNDSKDPELAPYGEFLIGQWYRSEKAMSVFGAIRCHYGKPGERLWVREAWQVGSKLDKFNGTEIAKKCLDAGYPKAGAPTLYSADGGIAVWGDNDLEDFGSWGRKRIGRFMPRWASRITLEITEVRVQRLQEISEEDALAEGVTAMDGQFSGCYVVPGPGPSAMSGTTAAECYSRLWNSINGAGSWDANPFVWALTFRRNLMNCKNCGGSIVVDGKSYIHTRGMYRCQLDGVFYAEPGESGECESCGFPVGAENGEQISDVWVCLDRAACAGRQRVREVNRRTRDMFEDVA